MNRENNMSEKHNDDQEFIQKLRDNFISEIYPLKERWRKNHSNFKRNNGLEFNFSKMRYQLIEDTIDRINREFYMLKYLLRDWENNE